MKVKKLKDVTEINEQEFNTWLEALYSGKYNQTTGKLQDDIGFCCLGVACEVLEFKKIRYPKKSLAYGRLMGRTPIEQPNVPRWLKYINRDVFKKTDYELVELNDTLNMTFPEIADTLYAVYVLGVLEEE